MHYASLVVVRLFCLEITFTMASPGLELLFNSVKNQLKTSQDALTAVFHWELISKGFKCIGNGEEVRYV